jgi:GTPase
MLVPVGTVIYGSDNNLLADITEDGQKVVLAKGGKGGFGNAHFVSSRRQAPRVAEKGEPGESFEATLELKMIAEVGLVGLPNAGKSTLLSRITNAKPEIADYPFTTIRPNLGVADLGKDRTLLVADIPGLIEGASEGKGLGDEFLRHVERTRVLIHLIDAYNEDVVAAYKVIRKELADYKVDLSKRPEIVALNKTEGLDKEMIADILKQLKKVTDKNTPVLAISAASGAGVTDLLRHAAQFADRQAEAEAKLMKEELPVISLEDMDDHWHIEKQENGFIVTGKKIERFAHRTDFANPAGVERLRDIMRKMGIMHDLERKKIEPMQLIIIGDPEIGSFEY